MIKEDKKKKIKNDNERENKKMIKIMKEKIKRKWR